MDISSKLFNLLGVFLHNIRDEYDIYETISKVKFLKSDYTDLFLRTKNKENTIEIC